MKVLFINSFESAFAGEIDIEEGMTVKEFESAYLSQYKPGSYTLVVGQEQVKDTDGDLTIRRGDKVIVSPSKIDGNI